MYGRHKSGLLFAGLTLLAALSPRGAPAATGDVTADGTGNGASQQAAAVEETAVVPVTGPSEQWKGTAVGMTDEVLPPWTPIEVRQAGRALNIACWGRTYELGPRVFPVQIVSAGQELLAGPVRLDVEVAGETLSWTDASVKVTRATDAEVDLAGRVEAGNIAVAVKARMEFDGMVWFDVELQPASPVEITRFALVMPIENDRAVFRHSGVGWSQYNGRLGTAEGWEEFTRPDYPTYYMWIGDEDRGLTWFTESRTGWRLAEPKQAVHLARTGTELVWTVNIINLPTRLASPLKVGFGLQATPMKPMPKGYRTWACGDIQYADGKYNISQIWPNSGYWKYVGYPEAAKDPTLFKEHVDKIQKRGKMAAPMIFLRCLAEDSPEYLSYGEDWCVPGGGGYRGWAGFEHGITAVCPACREWQDFVAYRIQRYMTEYGLDGLYFDLSWPGNCDNQRHGCSGGVAIRGWREMYKRIYATLKALERPTCMIVHCSEMFCTPMLSFSDMMVVGEEYVSAPDGKTGKFVVGRIAPGRPHLDVTVGRENEPHNFLDAYRTLSTGRQLGVAPCWLSGLADTDDEEAEAMRAVLLLHDAPGIWYSNERSREEILADEVHEVLTAFGANEDDTKFLPYWDNQAFVEVDFACAGEPRVIQAGYAPVLVSAYTRGSGATLLVVGNISRTDGRTTLRLDLGALGLDKTDRLPVDAFSGARVAGEASRFTLELKARDFRLIRLAAAR